MAKTPNGYDARGTWYSAANLWEAGEPFDRAAIYHEQGNRRPSAAAFGRMTVAQPSARVAATATTCPTTAWRPRRERRPPHLSRT